ncbi:unnamed protein product [Ixodes persulcatus]
MKPDLGCTVSEFVYGAALRLPADMVEPSMTTTIDPTSYVQRLGEAMSSLRPTQTRKPTARQVFIHPALAQSTHVFIRRDAPQKPLKPLYDGPYLVVDRTPKFYTVLLKGRRETVSLIA